MKSGICFGALATALLAFSIVLGASQARAEGEPYIDLRGAPGPIAGAGLPVLAVGFGIYWLVRRFRR